MVLWLRLELGLNLGVRMIVRVRVRHLVLMIMARAGQFIRAMKVSKKDVCLCVCFHGNCTVFLLVQCVQHR